MDMDVSSVSGSTCSMSMLWNWDTIDACFLTETWHITNNGMFAASCIGVVLLVVLLEYLRRLNREYEEWILRCWQSQVGTFPTEKRASWYKATTPSVESGKARVLSFRASPLQQLVRSVMHAVIFGLAYIIMLLVMSFNGYIFICVIIGAGLGKFICDWMTKKIVLGGGQEAAAASVEEPTVCCG